MESNIASYALRLVFALLLGGLIGIEREIKDKPAGMRTNMLMCMGSCLLMILSIEVARYGGMGGDPGRIAAQVVTGIGFLGAGTIIQSRLSVTGLTTAATLWFVAALGLVTGTGNYFLAAISTLFIIIVLTLVGRIETHLAVRQRHHILQFRVGATRETMRQVKAVLHQHRITPEDMELSHEERTILFNLEYVAPDRRHQSILEKLRQIEGIDVLLEY